MDSMVAPGRLRALADRLRVAPGGGPALDALVDDALVGDALAGDALADEAVVETVRGARWTRNLGDALTLVPADCNFSAGRRDGTCWAWIQPNDDWQPAELEARHDHPGGSGLIVAATVALALTAAAIVLASRRTEAGRQDVLF